MNDLQQLASDILESVMALTLTSEKITQYFPGWISGDATECALYKAAIDQRYEVLDRLVALGDLWLVATGQRGK